MTALEGLSFVPAQYLPVEGVAEGCATRTLVMDNSGERLWGESLSNSESWLYRRIARLLQVLQHLHQNGFSYNILGSASMRVSDFYDDYVGLSDFRNAKPHGGQVWRDAEALVELVGLTCRDKPWFAGFKADFGRSNHPDYNKWIRRFFQMS